MASIMGKIESIRRLVETTQFDGGGMVTVDFPELLRTFQRRSWLPLKNSMIALLLPGHVVCDPVPSQ